MPHHCPQPDPQRDLVLERIVDLPRERLWAAWTTPEHITEWFCPAPWKTVACEIDLRRGGLFSTVMRSPEGQEHPNVGCFLEVVENELLVWTDALGPGYRPTANPFMTGVIHLEDHPQGTKYTAMAIHKDAATCRQHEEMGFHQGWGIALDQLVAHMKRIA